MKKRLISLLLAFSMMLTFLPAGAVSAFAEESTLTYDCGESVTATLSPNSDGAETYTLTIRGKGPMKNYDMDSVHSVPWYDAIPKITRLIVDNGVTSLGDCVLHGFDGWHDAESLKEVTLPEGLTYLGDYAFDSAAELKSITLPSTLTTIGGAAFYECTGLTDITIPSDVKTIDSMAFFGCTGLTSVTIPDKVETLRADAFKCCTQLTSINIPKSVKSMETEVFSYCTALTCITFEPGSNLTEVKPNGPCKLFTHTSSELKVYCEPGLKATLSEKGVPDERIITTVDVTLVDGDTITPKKIDYGAKIAALGTPTKPGYTPSSFTGWYTDADCTEQYPAAQLFTNINGTKLYAGWAGTDLTVKNGTISVVDSDGNPLAIELKNGKAKVPAGAKVTVTFDRAAATDNDLKFDHWNISGLNEDEKPKDTSQEEITFTVPADRDAIAIEGVCKSDKTPDANTEYPLTVTGGIVTVKNGDKDVTDTLTVTTDETTGKKTYSVPDGATVTVTLDKTLIPEGMVFDIWSTGKFSLPLGQDYKAESITFTMNTMSSDADIAAQYRDATIEDDGPNVLGTAAIIGTAAVGTAVLGYQAYSLGTEFAGKLMALPYFPSNRSALAMMLWEDAGKPMPESELLYPDVEQEEQDMDLQHAARWAMENELIPDLNDEGTAPEEMKFYPDNAVSKIDVLNAWQKAQELKQNA